MATAEKRVEYRSFKEGVMSPTSKQTFAGTHIPKYRRSGVKHLIPAFRLDAVTLCPKEIDGLLMLIH